MHASRQKPRVLLVEDHEDSAAWTKQILARHGYDVVLASNGATAEQQRLDSPPDLVLMDLRLPDVDGLDLLRRFKAAQPELPVVMVTGHGSVSDAVEAMKQGALNFIEKPVDVDVLLAVLEKASDYLRLRDENVRLRQQVKEEQSLLGDMLTKSEKMRQVFSLIRSVAPTDANILIFGENGTGKELIANALHQFSHRSNGPLVKINCAAIPAELIESELFGHRRGAFTGAIADKTGLMEQAHGGTLLLDEIGEMPQSLQAKLLRVLQERHVTPVGGTRLVQLDFRLICATNTDLQAAMAQGRFREDLYFRINTIAVSLPPLRERLEDIPLLANHFVRKFARQYARPVNCHSPGCLRSLDPPPLARERARARTRHRTRGHRGGRHADRSRTPARSRHPRSSAVATGRRDERSVVGVASGLRCAGGTGGCGTREHATHLEPRRSREVGDPAHVATHARQQARGGVDPRHPSPDALQEAAALRADRRRGHT